MKMTQPTTKFQRAYKACVSCRLKKARCELEDPENPPCSNCKRQGRACVFESDRAWTKRQKLDNSLARPTRSQSPHNDTRHVPVTLPDYVSEATPSTARDGDPERPTGVSKRTNTTAFESSFMRGVVANGKDALDILFDAATSQENENRTRQRDRSQTSDNSALELLDPSPQTTIQFRPESISKASPEIYRVWNICRFVRMGWLSSDEAITYVDLFFKHMNPLSPILTEMYAKHENHEALVTNEPFLCCAILMISSRYFHLPGVGSGSRCYFIHQRLWQHCQHLALRVMFGQEKGSRAKTRTIGTIEALLLMCEWHSRAIHFPPEHDGWDSDIHMAEQDDLRILTSQSASAKRWLEDVMEPAKRSDRMSWMLANFALSLALELNLFNVEDARATPPNTPSYLESYAPWRKWRLQRLLYLYNNQLACRLGCMTSVPQTWSRLLSGGSEPPYFGGREDNHSDRLLVSMMTLTKFFKSMTDVLFPSVSVTKQLIKEERYHGILDHFLPLLDQWKQQHLKDSPLPAHSKAVLDIEFHFMRAFANSMGMQAMCERAFTEGVFSRPSQTFGENGMDIGVAVVEAEDLNRVYVANVIDSALAILQIVIDMSHDGALRCAPVRVFLRITTAFVFLFKAISLGVKKLQLRSMLDTMSQGIKALRESTLDDMHLASHYATLLEQHLVRLRKNLVASAKPGTKIPDSRRTPAEGDNDTGCFERQMHGNSNSIDMTQFSLDPDSLSELSVNGEWTFGLPFDPSMAPFGSDPQPGFPPALDDGALDFLWNLAT